MPVAEAYHGRQTASHLSRHSADPEALGRGFAQMDTPGAVACDRKRHRLVVFTVEHADARRGAQVALFEELQERGIFLIHAQNLVCVANVCIRQFHSAVFAAEARHPAEQRNAVRAATVASETRKKQSRYFGRDAVLQTLGLFMRARPFQANDIGEQLLGKTVAQDQVLRRSLAFRGEFDASPAPDMKVARASHSLQRSRNGRGSDAEVFGQTRADRDLLFLDDLPDRLEVVFLRNAGLFAAHSVAPWGPK